MRTRDTYFSNYGLNKEQCAEIKMFCRKPEREPRDKRIIETACALSNENIKEPLFKSLTLGLSYDKLSARQYIPLSRVDFYGYQRRALFYVYLFCRLMDTLLDTEGFVNEQ